MTPIEGLDELPDEANVLRNWLEHDGINSGVVVPVCVEGKSIGLLGLDTVVKPREYPQSIVDRLRIVADMIGSTLRSVRAQKALQISLNEVKLLKDRMEQENIYLREEIEIQHEHENIIGKSTPILEMLSRAEQVAETDSTVLILGETGTGKELPARAINRMSYRHHRALITVNCTALPPTLIESEMFGREKGAFTGASSNRIGRFEIADGATVFLDEIGELTPEVQMKLLWVLQDGYFERLGSNKTIKMDVRIIAATNRDLSMAVHEGTFRRDLFYRLNVTTLSVDQQVKRLNEIKTGDKVNIEYYISLASEIREPTPEEKENPITILAVAAKAPPETAPAAGGLRQIKAVVNIVAIDRPAERVTLKGPLGNTLTIRVLDPSRLEKVNVGDTVIVLYTEALAVSVEKVN